MPLPNFIIIGAMKAGTTSLHENLKLHPEIGMSNFKEPNYFTRAYFKDLEWYQSIFSKGKVKYGEASPSYTLRQQFPETAERIFKTVPQVKLIYILRDPIDRIISHLHHNLYRDRFNLNNVNKEVLENPGYINTSKYYFQITSYLKFFDRDDILFVDMANLKKNPSDVLNEICDFIGVQPFNFLENMRISNTSSQRYLIKYHDTVHRYFPRKVAKLYHWLFYILAIKIPRPVLEDSTLISLKKALKEDVEKLKEQTGIDSKPWQSYNEIKYS